MTERFTWDTANDVHARSLARLESEQIIWITTIGRNGFPHAVPVWFLWHDGAVVIFSEPATAKVKNLRENEHALAHLEAGDDHEQLTVLQGVARISERSASEWLAEIGDRYGAKYEHGLAELKLTAETMSEKYSSVIVLEPTNLIAW
ncbi:pyridoxamine 5'-phosphate oxidase family protein [Agromyces atrinae]|uniref:pyridoxamine 5'-phosphate oxidase family protein n=1 Tax=Agromyces atrinae TaxID=592376 RepID=UPI001F5690C8|nr:pyridoxamine 5'-phosphate oxidase family protein [Agromyces atrinae]MCI2956254.1 pyridoxamine 5'-phosphate oxidase family protein [Agromyces atrinae]